MPNQQVNGYFVSTRCLSTQGDLHSTVVVVGLLLLPPVFITIRSITECSNLPVANPLCEKLSSLWNPWQQVGEEA
jgi:hypothetical protein